MHFSACNVNLSAWKNDEASAPEFAFMRCSIGLHVRVVLILPVPTHVDANIKVVYCNYLQCIFEQQKLWFATGNIQYLFRNTYTYMKIASTRKYRCSVDACCWTHHFFIWGKSLGSNFNKQCLQARFCCACKQHAASKIQLTRRLSQNKAATLNTKSIQSARDTFAEATKYIYTSIHG